MRFHVREISSILDDGMEIVNEQNAVSSFNEGLFIVAKNYIHAILATFSYDISV